MNIKKFTKEHKKQNLNKNKNLEIKYSILIEKLVAPKKFRKRQEVKTLDRSKMLLDKEKIEKRKLQTIRESKIDYNKLKFIQSKK